MGAKTITDYPYLPRRFCPPCESEQPYEGLLRNNGRTEGKRCMRCGYIEWTPREIHAEDDWHLA